jgi:hypothetical protein
MNYMRSFSLAFARMPRAEARGGMARGDRGVARRAKPGGFGLVPLGFATDAPPCGRGASLYEWLHCCPNSAEKPAPKMANFSIFISFALQTSRFF